MNAHILYSVVVPVYRNEDSLERVITVLSELASTFDDRLEAVFVVDGSPDGSIDVLRKTLPTSTLSAQVISLTRNFGSFSAIRVGLAHAKGEYLAVMAADLQEPTSLIKEFLDRLADESCDVVIGRRSGRSDPIFVSILSRGYWSLYRRFVNRGIPPGGVDVFGCSKTVARSICAFDETNTSLVGLLYWVGFRRLEVEYVRAPRQSGRSGWTFRRRARYLSDSVYAFTDLPIISLQIIGTAGVLASLAIGLTVFIAWLAGSINDAGYTPIMLVIVGSNSAVLLGLGVVGSYVWRGYENSKKRPLAIVMDREDFNG